MGKFNKKLVGDIREKHKQEQEQAKLHKKYEIPENYIVVEKTNTWKFTVTMFAKLIRLLATILFIVLAVIGLCTIVYPQIRNPFIEMLQYTFVQLKTMF